MDLRRKAHSLHAQGGVLHRNITHAGSGNMCKHLLQRLHAAM
jgi:hypothetical protein